MVKKASNFFKQNSVYGLDITFKKRSLIGNSKKAVRDEEWLRQRFLHPKEKRKFNRVSVGCKKKKKKKSQGAASDFEVGVISAEPLLSRVWFSDLLDQNVSIISTLRR